MAISRSVLCGQTIAFLGGIVGAPATGMLLTGLGAFIQGCAVGRAPWRWAILSITAWATGSGVAVLLASLGGPEVWGAPTQLAAGLTVVAGYASAFAGASLNWAASRIAQQG